MKAATNNQDESHSSNKKVTRTKEEEQKSTLSWLMTWNEIIFFEIFCIFPTKTSVTGNDRIKEISVKKNFYRHKFTKYCIKNGAYPCLQVKTLFVAERNPKK